MSSGGLGFVTRHSVFGDGNQTTAFFLLKGRAWEQAGMEKGPSQTQHWRERGTEPWPHVCLGDADLCLHSFHSLGEVSKTCHSHQIISASYRNIFWLLKKTARLSCLHCYAITFYITVKLNAGRFYKGQMFYKILGKHSTVSQWLLASVLFFKSQSTLARPSHTQAPRPPTRDFYVLPLTLAFVSFWATVTHLLKLQILSLGTEICIWTNIHRRRSQLK